MTKVAFAVVAHTMRRERAQKLVDSIAPYAQVELFEDDGSLGERANHARAWRWGASVAATHLVQVEDDALPVEGFAHHAAEAIAHMPSPYGLATFYTGVDGREDLQSRVTAAITDAERAGAAWLRMKRAYWGVCLVAPVGRCLELADAVGSWKWASDESVGHWASQNGVPVFASVPSLVDHDDGLPSTMGHGQGFRRVAHAVGHPVEWNTLAIQVGT